MDNERPLDYIPDMETFKRELFKMFPDGDPTQAFQRTCYHIQNFKTAEGIPVSFELLKHKFKAYIDLWNFKYGRKEKDGFLGAKDARKSLYDFIGDKMYNQEFAMPNMNLNRDEYLFGPDTPEILKNKLIEFKKRMKDG